MSGLLFALALLAADAPPLDQESLRQAMTEAAANPAAPSLVGRRFRIQTRFVEERPRRYAPLKESARWYYDRRARTLITSIGFGQITDQNFDGFSESGLNALPPLQSFFFHTDVVRGPPMDAGGLPVSLFANSARSPAESPSKSSSLQVADSTRAVSFGLAAPFQNNGPSALPAGMAPLQVSRARGQREDVQRFARGLVLVVEGQITDLGQKPPVFCGGYRGAATFKEVTGWTPNWIKDRQCFVTVRIDHVQVLQGDTVLSEWPKAVKPAD